MKRAVSSNKFDILSKKEGKRKNKKFMINIFDYAKISDKESGSKRSTDESSSEHLEHLLA